MKKTTTNAQKKNASPPSNQKLPNINQKGKPQTEANKSPKNQKSNNSKSKTNVKQSNNANVVKTAVNEDNSKETIAKKME